MNNWQTKKRISLIKDSDVKRYFGTIKELGFNADSYKDRIKSIVLVIGDQSETYPEEILFFETDKPAYEPFLEVVMDDNGKYKKANKMIDKILKEAKWVKADYKGNKGYGPGRSWKKEDMDKYRNKFENMAKNLYNDIENKTTKIHKSKGSYLINLWDTVLNDLPNSKTDAEKSLAKESILKRRIQEAVKDLDWRAEDYEKDYR